MTDESGRFSIDWKPEPLVDQPEPVASFPQPWNIKHLIILIALLAPGFAIFGLGGTIFLSIFIGPIALAPRGGRSKRLYWCFACYPLILLAGLYLFWFDGWLKLGNPLVFSLVGETNPTPLLGFFVLLMMFIMFCPLVMLIILFWTPFSIGDPAKKEWHWFARWLPLFLIPIIWSMSCGFLYWNPFDGLRWFRYVLNWGID